MAKSRNPRKHAKGKHSHHSHREEKPHSWAAVRSLFTCKYLQVQLQQQQQQQEQQQHHQQQQKKMMARQQKKKQNPTQLEEHTISKSKKQINEGKKEQTPEEMNKKCKKMKCSGSLCSNTKVMQKPEIPSPEQHKKRAATNFLMLGSSSESDASNRSMKSITTLNDLNANSSSSSSSFTLPSASPSISGSFRNMPFRKLSGCYECRMVVDPVLGMTRDPSLRSTICSCPQCGEIFMKPENLELHQAVRHAVSEMGPDDTSKNIVEIIFQSSWLRKQSTVCKIDRILKVQNTPKTISRFEEYRDSIKTKASRLQPKKHPRCLADGNELLRFHCTTFMCSLGLNGSSNLCSSIPTCRACSIIKNGFKLSPEHSSKGVLTTATSGKAHDSCRVGMEDEGKRAMLVCRVIAGRVKKNPADGNLEDYDSVGGAAGVYSNLDELYVFNPRAVLPCFVVIYTEL
ncbi:uncharacterized protein LOC127246616 [Andrographis paniculata]|uniref:uncharacterized protein LOC127246616 n=1 Tax=Andrographis paniculata TaxID=175694 RepID=UPI0021E7D9D8|nr:uncharacterized protein LOC127246616 [Andrographis paniculata]